MIHINAINGIFLHEAVECTLLCKYCTYEKTDSFFSQNFRFVSFVCGNSICLSPFCTHFDFLQNVPRT